jgi:hypothetical protein
MPFGRLALLTATLADASPVTDRTKRSKVEDERLQSALAARSNLSSLQERSEPPSASGRVLASGNEGRPVRFGRILIWPAALLPAALALAAAGYA